MGISHFSVAMMILSVIDLTSQCDTGNQRGRYLAPVPTSCLQYYLCTPGRSPMVMNCSEGTLFDDVSGNCRAASDVRCGTRSLRVPSLRSALPPATVNPYELIMSQPFTATNFDVISCQVLQTELNSALHRSSVVWRCNIINSRCTLPVFTCRQAAGSASSFPVLDFQNIYRF